MSRRQPKHLTKEERQQYCKEFADIVASLDNAAQVEQFFTDLLSETEMLMLARRLRIASLLLSGESYNKIARSLGTSSSTVAHVHHWLQKDNANIAKIEKQLMPARGARTKPPKTSHKTYATPGTMAWMRQRYPVHFLLFNLFSRK